MAADADRYFLFTYGTLRSGGIRAMPDLFPDSVLIGRGTVNGRLYDMVEYPALVPDADGGQVIGEVYEVDRETIMKLDEIEASAEYHRSVIEVMLEEGGGLSCVVYLPDPATCDGRECVASGDWISYDKLRSEPAAKH